MNFLLAAGRQLSLYEEWIAFGARQLLQSVISKPLQWSLYDRNPDLAPISVSSLKTLKLFRSNSYHHQTLLPFHAVVIAGSSIWTGHSMERLFGTLSKMEIPLLALGLEVPQNPRPLQAIETLCFARSSTILTCKNEATREWLRRFDLESNLVGCPSLFAPPPAFLMRPRPDRLPSITFCLEDSYGSSGPSEKLLRKLVRSIPKLSTRFKTELVCTHINDFMRFSTMFPGLVTYSYEARDYFSIFDRTDLVVTTSPAQATIANAMEKPAVLVTADRSPTPSTHLPFTYSHSFISPAALEEYIATLMKGPSLQPQIRMWKETVRNHWLSLFMPYDSNLRKAA